MTHDSTEVTAEAVSRSIERALMFLRDAQLPHGEFKTLLSSDMELSEGACVFDSSPFVTSLVLYSLSHVTGGAANSLVEKALGFLASEMELGGLWRYYSSRQFKHCRIPPDLDDTACCSYLLHSFGKSVPNNRWILSHLRDERGCFLTWVLPNLRSLSHPRLWFIRLVGELKAHLTLPKMPVEFQNKKRFRLPKDRVPPDEFDPVVNANVILYLGENEDTGAAIRYLIELVENGNLEGCSHYYPDPLSLHYAIARACLHSAPTLRVLREPLLRDLSARQLSDGSFETPLSTALAVCTMLTFDAALPALKSAIRYLLVSQRPGGFWDRYTFYRGPEEFWGSEELTTGLCLEALARHRNCEEQ
jgi:hypothetical protein